MCCIRCGGLAFLFITLQLTSGASISTRKIGKTKPVRFTYSLCGSLHSKVSIIFYTVTTCFSRPLFSKFSRILALLFIRLVALHSHGFLPLFLFPGSCPLFSGFRRPPPAARRPPPSPLSPPCYPLSGNQGRQSFFYLPRETACRTWKENYVQKEMTSCKRWLNYCKFSKVTTPLKVTSKLCGC